MEIERKFLVKTVPNLTNFKSKKVMQGYISTSPVIRIRKYGEQYILTIKGKGKLSREEYELGMDEIEFNNLLLKVESNIIEKERFYIPLENNLVAELDVFYGNLAGLFTVEVEFQDESQANEFVPPQWFGQDVTFESKYSNSSLSKLNTKFVDDNY